MLSLSSCPGAGHPTRDSEEAPTAVFLCALWLTDPSYNRYASIAAEALRKSLKEEARVIAMRRGEMDLRVAKFSEGQVSEFKSVHEDLKN